MGVTISQTKHLYTYSAILDFGCANSDNTKNPSENIVLGRMWWSICDHIRKICSRRILIERVFEVDIGDLFASLDVIKDNYAVVVEIDAVNKCVDDIAAKFWIEKISGAEFFKPCPDFAFGQANITCNTQLDQIAFSCCFLPFKTFHLFIDSFMRSLWRINQRIHQFIQFAVKLAYLFFAFIYFAARKLIVILSDDGFSNVLNMLRRKNLLHGLLDNIPFDEILLFVFLFTGVALFAVCAGIIVICLAVLAAS